MVHLTPFISSLRLALEKNTIIPNEEYQIPIFILLEGTVRI